MINLLKIIINVLVDNTMVDIVMINLRLLEVLVEYVEFVYSQGSLPDVQTSSSPGIN